MSRRIVTAVNMNDGTIGVFCNYEDKDRVKAIPTAKWDPANKCWRISTHLSAEVRRLVAELNQASTATAVTNQPLIAVLTQLFRILPAHVRTPAYRALAKALHPDTGGDEASTKALTAAWAALT